jgi:hypothetical protein
MSESGAKDHRLLLQAKKQQSSMRSSTSDEVGLLLKQSIASREQQPEGDIELMMINFHHKSKVRDRAKVVLDS